MRERDNVDDAMETPTSFSKRILFIGNSFTLFNGGIDQQLRALAPTSEIASFAMDGYTLEKHWQAGSALQQIRQGVWDYVVLQEQSQRPVVEPSKFFEYVQKFDVEIKTRGAKTILWMIWEHSAGAAQGVTTQTIADAFARVSKELGVQVAPVGNAFARVRREKPQLVLYDSDGHPTRLGTYLSACVFYAVIFEKSPLQFSYADANISLETKNYLEQIAFHEAHQV